MRRYAAGAVVAFLIFPSGARAQGGSTAARTAREIAERIFSASARGAGDVLGDSLRHLETRIARLLAKHGDDVAEVLAKTGREGLEVVERHGSSAIEILAKQGGAALPFLERNAPDVVARVASLGDEAVDLCVAHPGTGERILASLGEKGLEMSRGLDRRSVARLAGVADQIAADPRELRILATLRRGGQETVDFLWRNTLKIGFAAAVAILLVRFDEALDPETGAVAPGAALGAPRGLAGWLGGFGRIAEILAASLAAVVVAATAVFVGRWAFSRRSRQ